MFIFARNWSVQLEAFAFHIGQADYLGEDGEWYDYFTGSDGNLYNLTHVFYATNTSHLNVATIQRVR